LANNPEDLRPIRLYIADC